MKFAEVICSSNLTWKIYLTYKFKTLESLFTHVPLSYLFLARSRLAPKKDCPFSRKSRTSRNLRPEAKFVVLTYVCTVHTESPGCARVIYR